MKFSKATFCTLLVALVIFPVAAQDSMSIELVYEIDDVYVGEFSAISDVVLSPDGDHIIYADNDSNLVLFNILELEVVDVFEVPDSTLMPLFQWASNERYVAVTYDDGVRVWDVSNGTVTLFIENTRTVIGGLSTNSIAVTANNSDLAIYDLVTGNVGFNVDYDDPRRLFVEVDFQPGGDMVAINFDYERVVEIWNIEENTLQKEIRIPAEEYRSHSVSFSPDGTLFVIGSGSWLGKTSAWRIVDWEPLWTYEAPLPSTGLNWSADGGHLFSNYSSVPLVSDGWYNGFAIRRLDSTTGKLTTTYTVEASISLPVTLDTNEVIINYSSPDHILVLDLDSGEVEKAEITDALMTYMIPQHLMYGFHVNEQQGFIFASTADGYLLIWGLDSGELLMSRKIHETGILTEILAENHIVTVASGETSIKIWEINR